MSAGAIGGFGAAAATPAAAASRGAFGELTSEEFVRVMISELSNQDPFQPQDSSALLEQFSSLRNIESQLSLQDQIGALVLQNQIAGAGGLIGKLVAGLDGSNDAVSGLVTSVRIEDHTVMLELDTGKTLPMDRVTQIASLNNG